MDDRCLDEVDAIGDCLRRKTLNKKKVINKDNSEDEYNFKHSRRGLAIIIVNEKCSSAVDEVRVGSKNDRDLLQEMFLHHGFEIRTFWNKSSKEILSELHTISKEDHTDTDCLAVAISTHGGEVLTKNKVREDVIETKDAEIQTKVILEMFTDKRCPSLTGKPRLFFIQACRGYKFDSGQKVLVMKDGTTLPDGARRPVEDGLDAFPPSVRDCMKAQSSSKEKYSPHNHMTYDVPAHESSLPLREVEVIPAPCYKDFLVMYATPPGYYAFRRPSRGSWFIRCLNEVFINQSSPDNLTQKLTRVIAKVSQEKSSSSKNPHWSNKKQTPVIYSMLTGDVMLRSKRKLPIATAV